MPPLMKKSLLTLLLPFSLPLMAAEMKSLKITADDWAEGDPPAEVFVVDGSLKVVAQEGNKALAVMPDPITDVIAQLGASAAGEASIKARAFGSKRGRSQPRFGLAVHGMSGHRLILNAPRKQLELVKGETVLASAPLTWAPDSWVWLKLEARRSGENGWIISGKSWSCSRHPPPARGP
jgi:hypothetical protein